MFSPVVLLYLDMPHQGSILEDLYVPAMLHQLCKRQHFFMQYYRDNSEKKKKIEAVAEASNCLSAWKIQISIALLMICKWPDYSIYFSFIRIECAVKMKWLSNQLSKIFN